MGKSDSQLSMNISNILQKSKHGSAPNDLLSEGKRANGSHKSSGTNLSKQESKPDESNLAKLLTNLIGTRQQS